MTDGRGEGRSRFEVGPVDPARPDAAALIATHIAASNLHYEANESHVLGVEQLARPDVVFLGAFADAQLAAIGALRLLEPARAEIKSMHTAEDWRGRGAASALLAGLLEAARARGVAEIVLETGADAYAAPARALYERHGFEECAPFGDYPQSGMSRFYRRAL